MPLKERSQISNWDLWKAANSGPGLEGLFNICKHVPNATPCSISVLVTRGINE